MRDYKRFWIFPVWIFCLTATHLAVHAEFRTPEQIVAAFNGEEKVTVGISHYEGHAYSTPSGSGDVSGREALRKLAFQPRSDHTVDVSAYTEIEKVYGGENGGDWITTFRCYRDDPELTSGDAWLAYDAGKTYCGTQTGPHYLTLGAAYLYAHFVQGTLIQIALPGGGVYDWNAGVFRNALDLLYAEISDVDTAWDNPYLAYLLSITPDTPTTPQGQSVTAKQYWCTDYVLTYDYDTIDGIGFGDYYVFAMNVYPIYSGQPVLGMNAAMLYAISKNTGDDPPPPGVPEPAALLLWTLGGLGLGGTSWLRSRNKKKLALA